MVIDGGYAFQLESGASGDGELYTFNENGDNTAWQYWLGHWLSGDTAAGPMGTLGGYL